MIRLSLMLAAAALPGQASRQQPRQATAPFDLVQTFIRQIASFEDDRVRTVAEFSAENPDFRACVRNNTMFEIDLRTAIRYYRSIKLADSNLSSDFPPLVADLLDQKLKIVSQLTNSCKAFMIADPHTDYVALARNAPVLTGMSESIDKTLITASSGIFASLISQRPDSKNHLSHISITRSERDSLVNDIDTQFGKELSSETDKTPYLVVIAQIYRKQLLEYKCADAPWG